MSIISVKGESDLGEEELLVWIRTQEATYGELSRIGNEDGFTLGSFYRFDPDHPRPEIEADMEKLPENAPQHEGELARGEVYVSGELVHVVVYRPSA